MLIVFFLTIKSYLNSVFNFCGLVYFSLAFTYMKSFLKKSILNCLEKLGWFTYFHYRYRNNITVLMLHGVMEGNESLDWEPLRRQVPPEELQRVLQILSDKYQFITAKQSIDMLEGKIPIIHNALLVTFDDGYRNTIDYALPICELFGIKPIMFIATNHVNSGLPFWFDRLDYALQQNIGKEVLFEYQGVKYEFDTSSRDALTQSYKRFRDKCKHHFDNDIEMNKLFDELSHYLEIRTGKALSDFCNKDDWSAIASWTELQDAVNKDRLDIGSHTVDHWRIDRLNKKDILFQLVESKRIIEEKLSTKCDFFCYPNGDYNDLSIELLKKTGYRAAYTTDVGLCKPKDDLMLLKRFNFPSNKMKSEILYLFNR